MIGGYEKQLREFEISRPQSDSLTAIEDQSICVDITGPKMSKHSEKPTELLYQTVCRLRSGILNGGRSAVSMSKLLQHSICENIKIFRM